MVVEHGCETGKGSQGVEVVGLRIATCEARTILNECQYAHLAGVIGRLADFWEDALLWADLDILPLSETAEEIYRLKETGGPLVSKCVGVLFGAYEERKQIVVAKIGRLGTDGRVPRHWMICAEDRLERFLAGQCQEGVSVYTRKGVVE